MSRKLALVVMGLGILLGSCATTSTSGGAGLTL